MASFARRAARRESVRRGGTSGLLTLLLLGLLAIGCARTGGETTTEEGDERSNRTSADSAAPLTVKPAGIDYDTASPGINPDVSRWMSIGADIVDGGSTYNPPPPRSSNVGRRNFNSPAAKLNREDVGGAFYNSDVSLDYLLPIESLTASASSPAIAASAENPFRSSHHSPYSTFGIDVDNASYTNVRGYLTRGVTPPPSIVRIEEMINYFRYDYPTPVDGRPFAFDSEVVTCPWNREHLLVRLALQGVVIDAAQAPPSNLVFLIDVSGSMSPDYSLPLLKQAFHRLVDQLRPDDRVAIVVYAGASGLALASTPGSEKEAIHSAIDNLNAGGSTAGGAGIRLAYDVAVANRLADGNNRVILATDGDFNVGITSEKDLVALIEEKREKGVFLSVLGVGQGNYQDQKMERLADNGNGNYYYLDRIGEAERVLVSEMSGTLYTIAKDVKLQIAFNPEKVAAYRLIGYENRMLAARDFDDDTKDAGELGAGHQVTALYEVVPAGATVGHAVDTANAANDRLDEELPNLFTANDLLRARLRYKKPADSTSNLIEHIIGDDRKEIADASASTRLAVAVAAWGMSLRGSAYDGDVDPGVVRTWVPTSTTKYMELIELMEKAEGQVASRK